MTKTSHARLNHRRDAARRRTLPPESHRRRANNLFSELSPIDPITVGLSITSLVGSIGAAGAAVAVTYYFLAFLREQAEKQNRLFEDFKDYHAESQKRFQDQLDRLSDSAEQSQRGFRDQVTRITEIQNHLLRDAILATKGVEKSQDGAADTVRAIEKTIASLQLTVGSIDMLVHRAIDRCPSDGPKTRSYCRVSSGAPWVDDALNEIKRVQGSI